MARFQYTTNANRYGTIEALNLSVAEATIRRYYPDEVISIVRLSEYDPKYDKMEQKAT